MFIDVKHFNTKVLKPGQHIMFSNDSKNWQDALIDNIDTKEFTLIYIDRPRHSTTLTIKMDEYIRKEIILNIEDKEISIIGKEFDLKTIKINSFAILSFPKDSERSPVNTLVKGVCPDTITLLYVYPYGEYSLYKIKIENILSGEYVITLI